MGAAVTIDRPVTHAESPSSAAESSRLPGLDGLRGLAVVAVLVFHLWPRVLPGGFIGVSVFFTLSGFVITRVLLAEVRRSGSLSLRTFWARRLRRLWPASAACLAAIVVAWIALAWMTHMIATDIAASFAQVANWRFLLTGTAYGTQDLSPVAHFWSLSIEEQLYLVVPIVVWIFARRPRLLLAAFAALVVGSLLTTFANAGNAPVVYYSTFTRAAELAVGACLAVVATWVPRQLAHRGARWALTVAGVLALGALAWLCAATSLGTAAYYRGGLSALALLSVAVIAAAIWAPPVRRALSWRPLLWLGAVSYGVYLIHWPLHVALLHTSIPAAVQPWIVLALTFAIAPLSLRFFEQPIRLQRVAPRVLAPMAVGLTFVIVLGVVGTLATPRSAADIDFRAAQRRFDHASANVVMAEQSGEPLGTPGRPIRVAPFGDSTAMMLGLGFWGSDDRVQDVLGAADAGCPIGRGGVVRGDPVVGDIPTPTPRAVQASCDWSRQWVDQVRRSGGLDVAVLLVGNWDIVGRQVPALGSRWRTIDDPAYRAWLESEMGAAADAMHAAGAHHIVWLTLPTYRDRADDTRVEQYNALVRKVATTRAWVHVVDYAAYLRDSGAGARLRPDGIHLTTATAGEFSERWLNDQLIAAATAPSATR